MILKNYPNDSEIISWYLELDGSSDYVGHGWTEPKIWISLSHLLHRQPSQKLALFRFKPELRSIFRSTCNILTMIYKLNVRRD